MWTFANCNLDGIWCLLSLQISCFLNPTIYCCLRDDVEYLDEARRLIIGRCRDVDFVAPFSSNDTSSVPKQPSKPFAAIESFFNHCDLTLQSRLVISNGSTKFTTEQEIGMYISSIDENTDFHTFWNTIGRQLPTLSRLVRRFCIMTATSVASESAFSIAGYLQRKQRASLSPATLRYCMLLRDSSLSDASWNTEDNKPEKVPINVTTMFVFAFSRCYCCCLIEKINTYPLSQQILLKNFLSSCQV